MRKLVPLLDSTNAGNGRLMAADKNDRYVLKHCLVYLHRHLRRFPSYSRETCKMLVWTMGQDIEKIARILMDQFDKKQRLKFKKEFLGSGLDIDDFADILAKMLPGIKARRRRKVFQQILAQLEKRQKSLSFRGTADFEKNIMAVEKMFNLTERETELLIFLFIMSIYEQPQEYFVGHMECQKIFVRYF